MNNKGFNSKKIGENLKRKRNALRMTQAQLAEKLDVSVVHLSHLENGKVNMSMKTLCGICQVLECTPNDILLSSFYQPPVKSQKVKEAILNEEDQALIEHITVYLEDRHKS